MKYFEAFTGLAGFSKGIEQAYGNFRFQWSEEQGRHVDSEAFGRDSASRWHINANSEPECVGFSEIAKTPSAILRYRYPDVRNYGDASRIVCDEMPDFDLFCGGFPCQAFSIAGKRLGFEDTRGTLFFEIVRILREKRPSHFLLENVAGLLSHDNGNTFRTIIATLDEIGYDLEWTVVNSKHHGVPQNRERVFIIGHPRNGSCGQVFSFGEDGEIAEQESSRLQRMLSAGRECGRSTKFGINEPVSQDGSNGHIYNARRIRRFTPVECARLQGFPDDHADYGINEKGETYAISDTGKYQVFGNAVTVNVIEAIIEKMLETGCLD